MSDFSARSCLTISVVIAVSVSPRAFAAPRADEEFSVTIAVDSKTIVTLDAGRCYFFGLNTETAAGEPMWSLPARDEVVPLTITSGLKLSPIGTYRSGGVWVSPYKKGAAGTLTVILAEETHGWTTHFETSRVSHESRPHLADSWRLNGIFYECDMSSGPHWAAILREGTAAVRKVVVPFLADWMAWASTDTTLSMVLPQISVECLRGNCARFLSDLDIAGDSWSQSTAPVFDISWHD